MYHASELFIITDVLDIYSQQKQNTECMLSTTCLESKAADVSWSEGKEVFGAFSMYFCSILEDVSSVENVRMASDILSQVFIRYVLSRPSSIIK